MFLINPEKANEALDKFYKRTGRKITTEEERQTQKYIGKNWTPDEIWFLIKMYGEIKVEVIAKELDRKQKAVYGKIYSLGLRKHKITYGHIEKIVLNYPRTSRTYFINDKEYKTLSAAAKAKKVTNMMMSTWARHHCNGCRFEEAELSKEELQEMVGLPIRVINNLWHYFKGYTVPS